MLYCVLVGNLAREEMIKSKLPNSVLRRVWALSDIDKDGMLDRDEFAVAMFLVDHKLKGNDIPETLPERLVPPSKRAKPVSRRAVYDDSPGASYRGGGGYGRTGTDGSPSMRMGEYDEDTSGLGGYVD